MYLWNNHASFREQYVKANMYSTLKRLGTPDGRSVGPAESPPILQFHRNRNSNSISAPSSNVATPAPVLAPEVKQEKLIDEPSATKRVARASQSAVLKSSSKPAVPEVSVPADPNGNEAKEEEKRKKLRKEQEEQARKAEELTRKEEESRKEKVAKEEALRKEKAAKEEELRKEKAAAELKEKLRLEQKAKAKEAEERKRRKAEKAQAKAEYRAQKETELKEKVNTKCLLTLRMYF